MAFTVAQLLLTVTKQAQLEAALANPGEDEPLERCCAEAEADVARYTSGYVIAQASLDGWIRALALFKAYGLVGPVPADVQQQHDAARRELEAIAAGQRPNLERLESEAEPDITPSTGHWGSAAKFDV